MLDLAERSGLRGVAALAAFAAELAAASLAATATAATMTTIATAEAAFATFAAAATLELAFATGLAVLPGSFEVAIALFADFAWRTFAAELAAASLALALATTATATATAIATVAAEFAAFAGTALVARLGGRIRGLAAEEALHPAEEAAGLLRGGGFRGGLLLLRAGLALRAVLTLGTTTFLEATSAFAALAIGAFALGTITLRAVSVETALTAFATLTAEAVAFTALAALETAFTTFPALVGVLARGRREDVELGLLLGARSGRRCGNDGGCSDRSCRSGDRGFRLGRGSAHRSGGYGRRGGGLGLRSRGRSGFCDGGDRRGGRLGGGSGSRGSGLGLGRGGTEAAGVARQGDH